MVKAPGVAPETAAEVHDGFKLTELGPLPEGWQVLFVASAG